MTTPSEYRSERRSAGSPASSSGAIWVSVPAMCSLDSDRAGLALGRGNTEIHHLRDIGFRVVMNVGRLDVAVYHAVLMGIGQAPGELNCQFDQPVGVEPGQCLLVQPVLQRAARQKFHDHVRRGFGLADIEHGHNIGVGETARGTCFAQEALARAHVTGVVAAQHLDRQMTVYSAVEAFVDDGHRTPAELAFDLVTSDALHQRSPKWTTYGFLFPGFIAKARKRCRPRQLRPGCRPSREARVE